jgi:hypothetical protein
LAVSPKSLSIESSIKANSNKGYTCQDLANIVQSIADVYDKISKGWGASDFMLAYHSTNPKESFIGKTFARLFSERSSYSIEAHVEADRIVIDKGNHRVQAAKDVGIPVMPVWVSAPSDEKLDQVQQECENVIRQQGYGEMLMSHKTIASQVQLIHCHTKSFADKQKNQVARIPDFERKPSRN